MKQDKMLNNYEPESGHEYQAEKSRPSAFKNDSGLESESAFWRRRESTVPYATDGPTSFVEPAYLAGYQGYNQYGTTAPNLKDEPGADRDGDSLNGRNFQDSVPPDDIPELPIPPIPL